jgi:hypothetical protein
MQTLVLKAHADPGAQSTCRPWCSKHMQTLVLKAHANPGAQSFHMRVHQNLPKGSGDAQHESDVAGLHKSGYPSPLRDQDRGRKPGIHHPMCRSEIVRVDFVLVVAMVASRKKHHQRSDYCQDAAKSPQDHPACLLLQDRRPPKV